MRGSAMRMPENPEKKWADRLPQNGPPFAFLVTPNLRYAEKILQLSAH